METKPTFLSRIRGNAEWEVLRFLGGSAVMGTIGHALANSLHGHPTDWALFGVFLFSGCCIVVFAYHFQPKAKPSGSEPTATVTSPANSGDDEQERLADHLAALEDVRRREILQHESDLSRARQGCEIEKAEKQTALRRAEAAEAQVDIFTPLQWKALGLAKELQYFLSEMPAPANPKRSEYADGTEGNAPFFSDVIAIRGPYIDKLRILYARQYAERVKTLVEDFTLVGIGDVYLGHYVDGVSDHWHVVYVATALVRMAHQLDFPAICKEHNSWLRS